MGPKNDLIHENRLAFLLLAWALWKLQKQEYFSRLFKKNIKNKDKWSYRYEYVEISQKLGMTK